MIEDTDRCYAALQARDPRFDGWFVVGVTSTGIYCRPSCPAMTPKPTNVAFLPTAAAAQRHGLRACKRCRPDASPGSPEWDRRADLVGRAMRLIADGVVDREGVGGLSTRLGYSGRQVQRELMAEVGAGPLALARAQRAHTARVLIETTDLAFTDVAFAAGFGSVRQFNDTVRQVFAQAPTALRARVERGAPREADTIALRLAYRQPAALAHVIEHLAVRAVPGLEEVTDDGAYRRVLSLPHGTAVVALLPRADHVQATLRLADLRDLSAAVQRCRRLLDLDADPVAVDERLRADRVLAALVAATPGLRVPRSVDPFEAAVRTVVGQQVSLAGARHAATALVARYGQPLEHPQGGVLTSFPSAATLADADLTAIGLTRQRAATVRGLATAVADGNLHLDVGVDRVEARHTLGRCFGIGPWSVEEIALRGLGDPDAFPCSDLVLLRMAKALGLPSTAGTLRDHAVAWRPWRASAAQHLWRYGAAVRRRAA